MLEAMRILALADRRPDVPLEELLAERPGLVVCCGDLERRWLEPLRGSGVPAVGVYGNHCLGGYLEDLEVEDLPIPRACWRPCSPPSLLVSRTSTS
jgi:hypothetical protein